MTLRNAFEEMATEDKVDELLGLLRDFAVQQTRFARDSQDRQRVIVDGASTINSTSLWQNGNTWAAYYSTGAATSIDAREQQALQSQVAFELARQRWVVT